MWSSIPHGYAFHPRSCHFPCPKCSFYNSGDSPRQKEEKIKRPMNAFMVWSVPERKRLAKLYPSAKNVDISRMLGERWAAMTNAERKPAVERAQQLKKEHQIEHPDYKYRPRRRRRSAPDHHISDCVEHAPMLQFIPVEINAFSPPSCCFLQSHVMPSGPRSDTVFFNNFVCEEPRSAPPSIDNTSNFSFCSSVPSPSTASCFDLKMAPVGVLDDIDTTAFAPMAGAVDTDAMLQQEGADLLREDISLLEDLEELFDGVCSP